MAENADIVRRAFDAFSRRDLSALLALVDSAEKSAASVDKELNTANNAMNSTEQDPQP